MVRSFEIIAERFLKVNSGASSKYRVLQRVREAVALLRPSLVKLAVAVAVLESLSKQ